MIEILKKTPILNKFSRLIWRKFNARNNKVRADQVNSMPRFPIDEAHVEGGEIISNRKALIEKMPQNAIVAECGVDEGDFSTLIQQMSNPKKLHLIDTWSSNRYNESKAQKVYSRFDSEITDGSVIINRLLSIEAAEIFDDNYFDWIYIDTAHNYKTTIQELYAFAPKVKRDGFITGHDYTMGNWKSSLKYGVIEAVAEFCVRENWKIAYWTADFTEGNSFAITRIPD